ncbi:TRAP transporter substrate-binding protein [Mesorhizobium microcysteis]|jgi:TRAP-type C4-dicarboxylate transport system substrate-binding protein|uniref:TRAP transporter substrate-binding protein n=1 Tax=Neoaquamicrobium microcysteis TaxID=2682781 RepID=A0A5D4GYE8_9HYPH|nr:TRAP transporter substrate-binding protein [Mesorhizobium microcysteis]TYR31550.1 TRAP transporter substrate-binding protein [Mesorhizobium microcysteis]
MKSVFRTLLAGAALLPLATAATAQDLPATDFNVVGSWSNLPLYQEFERKFWEETVPAESGGAINVTMTTFDQMGVAGADVYRMLGDGVFDVGMTVADYTVGDAPELEGLDVPLIAMDAGSARKMVDAAKPWVADIMRDRFNAHALAIAPYPPQIVFCNAEIASLDDLAGKKIRGSGRMTSLFLEALGAEGITLAFSEVPGALERGVIDCAVTGAGSGYASGWHESSTHLVNLPLGGWDPVVTAVNLDKWESLDPAVQAFLTEKAASEFETPAWEDADGALARDIACLTGSGECARGPAASMTLVEVSAEDQAKAVAILEDKILPDWAQRAGGDWAQRWNETVGATLGVSIAE